MLLCQMHKAFKTYKIYEYPGIKAAATDPDFVLNMIMAEKETNRALQERSGVPIEKDIAFHLKGHAGKWRCEQTYE